MRKPFVLVALLFAAILAAMAATSLLVSAPPLRSANAPDQFDASRAKHRLVQILGDQRPHPADSPTSDVVRSRLLAELQGMGLRPMVRDQMACNEAQKARGVTCARVRNIIVTLGPAAGKALLLNTHYDSTPVGPGAGDAGIGVATLLEVAEILKDSPLPRPVILLFNEGEELGLIGARAFLADPLSRSVDSLINLEARGVRGPANMFETSVPNGPAIAAFARAVDRPVANSLSTDVYRLMPNYTDVNSFDERGWLTLNLAIIGNETRYHSPGDDIAALDPASLQHMGDQTLALARQLASGVPPRAGERMFMDVLGRQLVMVPTAVGLTVLQLLLLFFAWAAWRRKALFRGLLAMTAAVLLATLLGWLGQAILGFARPGLFWRAYPVWTLAAVYASALLAAVIVLQTFARRLDRHQQRAAFWLLFLILGSLLVIVAPGGAIFFLIPPMLIVLGIALRRWWSDAESIAALLAVLTLYLTFGAMLGLLQELLNQGPMWVFAPLGVLIIMPALIEARPLLDKTPRRGAILAGTGLALLGWIAVGLAPAYSQDRKQRLSIEYVHDAISGRTYWSIANDGAPPRTFGAGWTLSKVAHSEAKRWIKPSPAVPGIEAPAVDLLAASLQNNERRVRLRLRSNGADSVILIAPKDGAIRAAGVQGFVRSMPVDGDKGRYVVRCTGRSCDGALLDLVIRRRSPVPVTVVGTRGGLPTGGLAMQRRRPANAAPQYIPDQTVTVTRVRV